MQRYDQKPDDDFRAMIWLFGIIVAALSLGSLAAFAGWID
jgi:hypothetical protein